MLENRNTRDIPRRRKRNDTAAETSVLLPYKHEISSSSTANTRPKIISSAINLAVLIFAYIRGFGEMPSFQSLGLGRASFASGGRAELAPFF